MATFSLSLELAAYFLGKTALFILLPWCRTELPARRVWTEPREWTWKGFSYVVGRRRVIRTEAVELAGACVMIGFVALGLALRSS